MKKINLTKYGIGVIVLMLYSWVGYGYSQSVSYSSLEECNQAKQKNSILYKGYSRSSCYYSDGYYYYNLCDAGKQCPAGDNIFDDGYSKGKNVDNKNVSSYPKKQNTSSNSKKETINLGSKKSGLAVCIKSSSYVLSKDILRKLNSIIEKLDQKIKLDDKVAKGYVYGYYSYVLWLLVNSPKYRNNYTIKNIISYLQSVFNCWFKKTVWGKEIADVDYFIKNVFKWVDNGEDRTESIKKFLDFFVKSEKKRNAILSFIEWYKYIPEADKKTFKDLLNVIDVWVFKNLDKIGNYIGLLNNINKLFYSIDNPISPKIAVLDEPLLKEIVWPAVEDPTLISKIAKKYHIKSFIYHRDNYYVFEYYVPWNLYKGNSFTLQDVKNACNYLTKYLGVWKWRLPVTEEDFYLHNYFPLGWSYYINKKGTIVAMWLAGDEPNKNVESIICVLKK